MSEPTPLPLLQRISQRRINPPALTPNAPLADVIDQAFLSYNAGRLREACQLFARKMLADDAHRRPGAERGADAGRAGHVVPGAADRGRVHRLDRLAPARTCTTTPTSPWAWTCTSRGPGLDDSPCARTRSSASTTSSSTTRTCSAPTASTAPCAAARRSRRRWARPSSTTWSASTWPPARTRRASRASACWRPPTGPACRSSRRRPGDSSIGMNLAALQLEGSASSRIDPLRDVNQTAAIVWDAKRTGRGERRAHPRRRLARRTSCLQTEPQIQEVLGLEESGHDYFLQFTDARPDTGGLSGATPGEAMTWGKVDPGQAARHGDLLRRFDGGPAAADGLRPHPSRTPTAPATHGADAGVDETVD